MNEYTPTTDEVFLMWECLLWEGIASNESKKDADWDGDRMRAQLSRWLQGELAKAWDEGEANVYIGRYDQYDTGSLMKRGENPYRNARLPE